MHTNEHTEGILRFISCNDILTDGPEEVVTDLPNVDLALHPEIQKKNIRAKQQFTN